MTKIWGRYTRGSYFGFANRGLWVQDPPIPLNNTNYEI